MSTVADRFELIPKDCLETYHHNLDPPQRGWHGPYALVILRSIIWMGNWTSLHKQQILNESDAVRIHGHLKIYSKT